MFRGDLVSGIVLGENQIGCYCRNMTKLSDSDQGSGVKKWRTSVTAIYCLTIAHWKDYRIPNTPRRSARIRCLVMTSSTAFMEWAPWLSWNLNETALADMMFWTNVTLAHQLQVFGNLSRRISSKVTATEGSHCWRLCSKKIKVHVTCSTRKNHDDLRTESFYSAHCIGTLIKSCKWNQIV